MSYPALFTTLGMRAFAEAVDAERQAQLAKWGDQHHPDGTGSQVDRDVVQLARHDCQTAALQGAETWRLILNEEVCEAFAETDPAKLRTELVQCAAVIQAWLADLDSRDQS